MTLNIDVKRNFNFRQIFEIFKFEVFLNQKRHLVMVILSLVVTTITAGLLSLFPPSDPMAFAGAVVGQTGAFLMFIVLFFAGGILADEFDKRTALTNFSKTGRDNFFMGKSLAAFAGVLSWIGPAFVETIIFSLILYQQVSIELFMWFGYYCIVGGAYSSLYLLCSAIFRSGGQAMTMGFVIFIAEATAFGLFLAFLNFPYPFLLFCEIAGQAIFVGDIDLLGVSAGPLMGIMVALAYLIPCQLFAYVRFKTRDV